MKRTKLLNSVLPEAEYITPQCEIIWIQMENILCLSAPGDNIDGWEGEGDGFDDILDSDF